jgi:tryptophan synthase beta subunit
MDQMTCSDAVRWTEGIIPALEPSHAIYCGMMMAKEMR